MEVGRRQIVGGYLEHRSRKPLDRLAKSVSLCERRISIVATGWFIWRDDFAEFEFSETISRQFCVEGCAMNDDVPENIQASI